MTDILKIKTTDGWKGIAVTQGDITPVQSDWSQSDSDEFDYIKNKPAKLSDFADDTSTNPIDKADTLTGLTSSVTELNYCSGVSSNIQTQLNSKSSVDLSDVDDSGTSLAASWGMPSNTRKTLTLGASGTRYTAPANGWFYLTNDAGGGNPLRLINLTAQMITCIPYGTPNFAPNVYIPAQKSDVVEIGYVAPSGSTTQIYFIYAQGSESEAQ